MADRAPYIRWPGVDQPVSLSYVLSQGISPGSAVLRLLPQDASKIALQGDLVFGDGVGQVRLRNCKVAYLRTSMDPASGRTWSLDIVDRRWRWMTTGLVAGAYNVPDATRDVTRPPEEGGPFLTLPRYYVPWTVRTPHELIKQCLDAMGETRYRIDAPNVAYPLPAIQWDYSNPAQMLSQLCEMLGCRIVYRPDIDGVWIVPIGRGAELPEGGPGVVYRDSPGMKTPARPDSIMLVGAPIKFQVDWILEAVGEEWDGSLKPIDSLSYAPPGERIRQRVRITPVTVANATDLIVEINHKGIAYTATYTTSSTSVSDACTGLKAVLDIELAGLGFQVDDQATYVEVIGTGEGIGFATQTATTGASELKWELTVQGKTNANAWARQFPGVGVHIERDKTQFNAAGINRRLTYQEALEKANRSVFRYYRITNVDPVTGERGIDIPLYGKLDTEGGIYRAILLNEQLEQAVPVQEDQQVFRTDGEPVSRDFYDGLFRWKPARCFGRYHRYATAGLFKELDNTTQISEPNDEVLVDFNLNPQRGLVIFNQPVFIHEPTYGCRPAQIRLRCACHLRENGTNHVLRHSWTHEFPGPKLGTKPAVIHHHDVEKLVKATYTATWYAERPEEFQLRQDPLITNDEEIIVRSEYYLAAAALRYQIPQSGERQYNGVFVVFPDGAIQQVSWSVSIDSGADTVASRNAEHFIYAPQYPERLRWEYLDSLIKGPAGQGAKPTPASMTLPGGGAPGAAAGMAGNPWYNLGGR